MTGCASTLENFHLTAPICIVLQMNGEYRIGSKKDVTTKKDVKRGIPTYGSTSLNSSRLTMIPSMMLLISITIKSLTTSFLCFVRKDNRPKW